MKTNSRHLFKKNTRQQFIERFKTEVQESSSLENNHLNQKMYNSISPRSQHSLERKAPLRTCTRTNHTTQFSSRGQKSGKPKIRLIPSSTYRATARKDKYEGKGDCKGPNQPFNNILMSIFEELQYKKQDEKDVDSLEDKYRKICFGEVEECVLISGILFQNARKLRIMQQFRDQARTIENIVKKMILKLKKVYEEKLRGPLNIKAEEQPSSDPLKKKLFQEEDSAEKHCTSQKMMIKGIKEQQGNEGKEDENKFNNLFKKKNIHSSCKALSSLSSFKIENEDVNAKDDETKMKELYQSGEIRSSGQDQPNLFSIRQTEKQGAHILRDYHDQWKNEVASQNPDSQIKRSFLNEIITALNQKFKKKGKSGF